MNRLDKERLAWLELTNPLHGLSIARAEAIFDAARRYGSPQLQYIYSEIEAVNPVLFTCVERRASALASVGWKVSARSAAADGTLAEEQRAALDRFAAGIDNLTEAIEHLDLGFFRGFSHVQPIWEGAAALPTVKHIALLDSWNFLRGDDGEWFWNPECRTSLAGLAPCRDARLVTVARRRSVDRPALAIHIRHALGERDWGRFIERYGVPPCHAVMGPGATDADRARYQQATDAAQDGASATWPSGTSVTFAEGARGTDPFTPFVREQEKQILILATGGTLATLSESGSGTLAGAAQDEVWKRIVMRDGAVIADALNRALFWPFLRAAFNGRSVCADFEIGRDQPLGAAEVFDLAAKSRAGGYLIERAELEEATGYTLVDAPSDPMNGSQAPGLSLNKSQTPLQTHEKPLQNARRDSDGQGDPRSEDALVEALRGLFEKSLAEAAAEELENEGDEGEGAAPSEREGAAPSAPSADHKHPAPATTEAR